MYSFIYFLTFLVIPDHQKFFITNSVVFHYPPCPSISISWCNWITSALSLLFPRTYTFLSFNIKLFSSHYSLSLNILTFACFISSTALTTLSSFTSDFLIFSNKFTSLNTTSTTCTVLTSNYSFFTSTLSLLSLSTLIYQSRCLLRLLVLSILLPGTCLSIKSNLNKYNIYLVCLWFNFWLLMKYSRFSWSL